MTAANRSGRAEWSKRLEKWRRSGLGLREFAEREGVSLRTLSWWRWRVTRDGEPSMTATARATALVPMAQPVTFVELATEPEPMTPIEILLGNGRVVRVPAAFDDRVLSRVLAVADGVA